MSGALPGTLYAFVLVSALSLLMLWRLRESLLALLRMVTTHSERYGQDYWGAFDAGVAPHLPASPGVIDLGCGSLPA